LNNLKILKQWQHVPYFVTVAHHFYNHLCGHAKSLYDIVGSVSDQSEGMGTGFTELGKKVLREVLSSTNGKRIYIDIKHMSASQKRRWMRLHNRNRIGSGYHTSSGYSHGSEGNWNGDRYGNNNANNGGHYNNGNHYGQRKHSWARGERLPSSYYSDRGHYVDYRVYHLRQPPRGYQWVRVDDNYALVALTTGLIASIIASSR